ncbi:MAG: phosphoglucosamine mutase [Elusimicrobia bacterium]|nr:phosphoglucosamine mutase [Elusimicrobiota bacterium]
MAADTSGGRVSVVTPEQRVPLFGTDGIRGIAGEFPLVPEIVERLGETASQVYRRHWRGRRVELLVGRDTRDSGPWLLKRLAAGLRRGGFNVRNLGVITTPALAYLIPHERVTGGVMISASHNPAAFNGLKWFAPDGRKLPDAWEGEIEQRLAQQSHRPRVPVGSLTEDPLAREEYLAFVRRSFPAGRTLRGYRLVIDCANGAVTSFAATLFPDLGAAVNWLGIHPTGKNINQRCGAVAPQRLQQRVRATHSTCGFAFDGDSDRVAFVDEQGRLLDGDHLLAIAAQFLKAHRRLRGNVVVTTVMANLGLLRALEAMGIRVVLTPVGDRYVSEAMEREGAVLGGEQSGHLVFREFLSTGDGLITALQTLAIQQAMGQPFSRLRRLITKYPQALLNIRVRERQPLERLAGVQSAIRAASATLGREGRVFVRYSGTEPYLRVMVEGPHPKVTVRLAKEIAQAARSDLADSKSPLRRVYTYAKAWRQH